VEILVGLKFSPKDGQALRPRVDFQSKMERPRYIPTTQPQFDEAIRNNRVAGNEILLANLPLGDESPQTQLLASVGVRGRRRPRFDDSQVMVPTSPGRRLWYEPGRPNHVSSFRSQPVDIFAGSLEHLGLKETGIEESAEPTRHHIAIAAEEKQLA